MIFVVLDKKNKVVSTHSRPDIVPDDVLSQGYLVNRELPEPEYIRGKSADIYYDPSTDDFSFQYVDRPLTEEEKLEVVLEQQEQLENENADLWYDTMLKDARISEHDNDIAGLWYELMLGGVA